MRGILYEQYPQRPHRGTKLKKPIGVPGAIDVTLTREAIFFDEEDRVISEMILHSFEIHKAGLFLIGVQGRGNIRWIQEWFVSVPVPKSPAADA